MSIFQSPASTTLMSLFPAAVAPLPAAVASVASNTPMSILQSAASTTTPMSIFQSVTPAPTIVSAALPSTSLFASAAPAPTSLFAPATPVASQTTPSTQNIKATLVALAKIVATNNGQAAPALTSTAPSPQMAPSSSQVKESPQESRLKDKSLDEITDQWANDVGKYKKEFRHEGENIKKWDAILIEGQNKITRLTTATMEAERTQIIIGNALEQLEGSQLNMEKLFDYYEAALSDMDIESLEIQPTDLEREQIFDTIIKLSGKLAEMETWMGGLITSLNHLNLKVENSNTDSHFSSIVRILNQHLQVMQWINTQTAALSVKAANLKVKSWVPHTEGDETMRNLDAQYRWRN